MIWEPSARRFGPGAVVWGRGPSRRGLYGGGSGRRCWVTSRIAWEPSGRRLVGPGCSRWRVCRRVGRPSWGGRAALGGHGGRHAHHRAGGLRGVLGCLLGRGRRTGVRRVRGRCGSGQRVGGLRGDRGVVVLADVRHGVAGGRVPLPDGRAGRAGVLYRSALGGYAHVGGGGPSTAGTALGVVAVGGAVAAVVAVGGGAVAGRIPGHRVGEGDDCCGDCCGDCAASGWEGPSGAGELDWGDEPWSGDGPGTGLTPSRGSGRRPGGRTGQVSAGCCRSPRAGVPSRGCCRAPAGC